MKHLFYIFCLFLMHSSNAQDCNLDFINSQQKLKKQQVKKVNVFVVDKATSKKTVVFQYQFHKNGSAHKFMNYPQDKSQLARGETDCVCSADSLVHTNTGYIINSQGEKRIFSRKEMEYNSKKQLIKQSLETFEGNYLRHITYFNPKDLSETNIEVIAFENNDTVRHTKQKKNKEIEVFVFREKRDGAWEIKKQITKYKKGNFSQFEEYINGKQTQFRKAIKNAESKEVRENEEGERENGLPMAKANYVDSVLIDVQKLESNFKVFAQEKLTGKPLSKITYFQSVDKKDPFQEDFYYNSGLLFIKHSTKVGSFLFYEYEFFTE